MQNRKLINALIAIQAIPVPFSLLSILGAIPSFVNMGGILERSVLVAVFEIIFAILSVTYTVTFIFSASKTFENEEITFISFLPLLHLLLSAVVWVFRLVCQAVYL